MSFDSLQPSSLDPSGPRRSRRRPRKSSSKSMVWVAAALVLVGLGLVGWAARNGVGAVVAPVSTPTPVPVPTATPDPALRLIAEGALEDVVEVLGALRPTAPEAWAGEDWANAMTANEQGDGFMAEQEWEQATEAYNRVSALLLPLQAQLPQVPGRLMPLVLDAIAAGEKAKAVDLVEAILFVDPEVGGGEALLARARVADQSLAALTRGQELLEQELYDEAYVSVQQVKKLDPLFPGFNELEEEVEERLIQRELGELLGRISAALDAEDLDTAEAALREAQQIDPDHPGVEDAARQVNALILTRMILKEKAFAEKLAAEEKWSLAHGQWLKIKALDPYAPWVDEGLETSKRWAVIDVKLKKGMEAPASDQTRTWLMEFEDQSGWPSGLVKRAEDLQNAHTLWTTPVPVVLVSDGETEVTLRKVGQWSELIRKKLSLQPGDYVATGGRMGYRDVRVAFTVEPGADVQEVEVICTEGI